MSRLQAAITLGLFLALPIGAVEIGPNGGLGGSYGLHEEESRYFPGAYYFHKGCNAFKRGEPAEAMRLWQIAAGWGQKGAQYDIGIAHFKGRGVAVDRASGLAWLALASERHEPQFQQSFEAAWYEASDAERTRAKALHAELKRVYSDAVALKRAARRYEDERRNVTGSRLGAGGHAIVYAGGSSRGQDVSLYLAEVEQAADAYFGTSSGSVSIGPLMSADDPAVADPPQD